MPESTAKFSAGDLVRHRLFDYRGVVVDVDASFRGSEQWYEEVARTRPPRDAPWYHVLVDGASHLTYVAERNLDDDDSGEGARHPLLDHFFEGFEGGRYVPRRQLN